MSPTLHARQDTELQSCQLSSISRLKKKQLSSFSLVSRPLSQTLSQGSIVFPRSGLPLVLKDTSVRDRMSVRGAGLEENIFHWKNLNLSKAKLKASSRTSALLSGFVMVILVEIQIDKNIPPGLLVSFVVCTVLLIAVHMLALMISTCILPNVEAVSNLHIQGPNTVFESPHSKMASIVEMAWGFSTVLGILLFLVEICILCWVKFYQFESHLAAWVATALLIPIFFVFIAFAAHFYLKLVGHKSEVYEHNIKELELLKDQLDDTGESMDTTSQNGVVNII